MAYQMQHAGYGEYKKFCEAEHLVPVPYKEYTGQFFLDFCKAHGMANAVQSAIGTKWSSFETDDERTAAGLGKSVFTDTAELKRIAKNLEPLA